MRFFPVLALAVLLSSLVAARQPQTGGRTVWNGVYTEAQAARGKGAYETSCASCHRGGPGRDDAFLRDWSGSEVDKLFLQLKTSMPPGAPSSLSDSTYLDIVAYVLLVNSFPAGTDELRMDVLKSIRIEGRNGPDAVPNYALISAVGCLEQGSNSAWILARVSEPARTKNPATSRDDELELARRAAGGSQTLLLVNVYPRPDQYKGHRVEAKGFLIREADGGRVNVTSIQSLAPQCD